MTAYQVRVTNQYLYESVKLTHFQNEYFWTAVQHARTFHGGQGRAPTDEQLADQIVHFWNNKHFQLIGEEGFSVGLGGLIRIGHVKSLLWDKGHQIKATQLGVINTPRPTRRTLKREDIDSLSYRDAEPWLIIIGKTRHGTKPKRLEELRKHFVGKPSDYELSS